MIFGQTEVSDGYVELIRVLGGHGLIGVILGVVAIFGLLCLTAVWTIKKVAGDTILAQSGQIKAQSEQIKDLAVSVGTVHAKIEETAKADVKQDHLLAEHDARLDNHEVRIVKLETEPGAPAGDRPKKK